jgi:hypothetical protein
MTALMLAGLAGMALAAEGPEWRAFNGVDYLAPAAVMGELGLGWARESFPIDWNAVEPKQDEWHWEAFDAKVTEAHAQGVEVLPMLGYTAAWAATVDGGFGPAANVADWEDYVEHVVARYSRPPYSLRFYQVWNEPTWEPMTFWKRTGPEWIDQVYLPAAKTIRRHGCQVVFGGWPVADAGHLFEALEYHEAWRWTDIIDVHYFGIGVWQEIYDRYLKDGKCRGAWQTELGFHEFPAYIPNLYPRALHWALAHGWPEEVDKYKLFWFASWGAGPDGPKCLTMPGEGGNTLTAHGLRLRTLNQVLGGGKLSVFTDYTTDPPLPPTLDEEQPASLGFRVDGRTVVVLILDAGTLQAHPSVRLSVKGAGKARLISSTGEGRELECTTQEGTLRCTIPMSDLPCEVARDWGRKWAVAVGYVIIGR